MWKNNLFSNTECSIIHEAPLSINIQGKPYTVVLRTPGDESAHAAGLCFAEGIINSPDDINSIIFSDDKDNNEIRLTLKESRINKISHILERRSHISQTSCNNLIKDLNAAVTPSSDTITITPKEALNCLENLSKHQPLRSETHASHAAALYSSEFKLLGVMEDVGRHNALDKVTGQALLDKKLRKASILTLSSRISYELVQKAARAQISIILAISRPTSLAVNMASRLKITLACLVRDSGLYIFTGEDRFNIRSL